MTKATVVSMLLALACTLSACEKKSMCSDESRAALGTVRMTLNGMSFDKDELAKAEEKITAVQLDLNFDGGLRTNVESLLSEIANARRQIGDYGDFAEDGDLSGLDSLASAQESIESSKKDVMRSLDDAQDYCLPR